jgi:hypothetical protein
MAGEGINNQSEKIAQNKLPSSKLREFKAKENIEGVEICNEGCERKFYKGIILVSI